jgi:hypothetical protein
MLTTLYGWESEADKDVIVRMEVRFDKPLVCFTPIQQPTDIGDGYWHCRVKCIEGVIFVRQDGIGCLHMYGPLKSDVIN